MSSILIEGVDKLSGIVEISGSKNSALPILASTVLNGREYIIKNIPDIRDVRKMLEILTSIGCKSVFQNGIVSIDTTNINTHIVPALLVKKIRSSIILMGAILARTGKVEICYPGGCEIGMRPIDLHLKSLKKLGVNIVEKNGILDCNVNSLKGCDIHLDYPSVGATENIILASIKCKGTTTIRNAAKEPEIEDLQNFLNLCGYNVYGAGTSTITIIGKNVTSQNAIEYKIIPDRIETGTFLTMAAMKKSQLVIKNANIRHLHALSSILEDAGCVIVESKDELYIKTEKKLKAAEIIRTQPYPGFPTDMQAQVMTAFTVAKGTTIVKETVFENRFRHVPELIKMGADIKIIGRAAVINGVEKLYGAEVNAKDLRGGAALVIAATIAEGKTKINNVYHISRGYENFINKLNMIGVKVQKMSD